MFSFFTFILSHISDSSSDYSSDYAASVYSVSSTGNQVIPNESERLSTER